MAKAASQISKLTRFVSSTPALLATRFRKWKFDNFVGGLIFGAVFGLIVNVATIQIQESIARQRALESLEREVANHFLQANQVLPEETRIFNDIRAGKNVGYSNIFYYRLDTRVWDSTEVDKYVFQLDPELNAELTTYYGVYVNSFNHIIDQMQGDFDRLYNAKCNPTLVIENPSFKIDNSFCNSIVLGNIRLYSDTFLDVNKQADHILQKFHPTQDRLHSIWLRTLLGDKSVKFLNTSRDHQ